jgi:transketolase C-terminal domain/subunit
MRTGGIGESFCFNLLSRHSNISYKIFAVDDKFVEHGKSEDLLRQCGFDVIKIYHEVRECL